MMSSIIEETRDIVNSRINYKIKKKALILSHTCDDIVAHKIYDFLKREYTVSLCQEERSNETFYCVNYGDFEKVSSLMTFLSVDIVIITSELVDAISNISRFANFLVDYCNAHGVKLVFVKIDKTFQHIEDDLFYCVGYENSVRTFEIAIQSVDCLLFLNIHSVYGINDYRDNKKDNLICGHYISILDIVGEDCFLVDEVSIWMETVINEVGELDIIDASNHIYLSNLNEGLSIIHKQTHCIFKLIYRLAPDETFEKKQVATVRYHLGSCLATKMKNIKADCIIPVPQTGVYYALGLADGLGIPYCQALIKNSRNVRSFQYSDTNIRKQIINDRIVAINDMLYGKDVVLVDEAIFTGTTLKEVCKKVRSIGAKSITLAIPTPPCYRGCSYYMQPPRTYLLEYMRIEMLTDYFGVDNVFFQDRDVFDSVKSAVCSSCGECFEKLS